jgi:hypothetical protein
VERYRGDPVRDLRRERCADGSRGGAHDLGSTAVVARPQEERPLLQRHDARRAPRHHGRHLGVRRRRRAPSRSTRGSSTSRRM